MALRSPKNKGRHGEHQVAALIGGKRAPLSGAVGAMGDVIPPELYRDLIIEVKRRARLPHLLSSALDQASAATGVGDLRKPAVFFREDRGRWMVCMWGEDFVGYTSAPAEVGQGHKAKEYLREIRRAADALWRLLD